MIVEKLPKLLGMRPDASSNLRRNQGAITYSLVRLGQSWDEPAVAVPAAAAGVADQQR